MNKQIADLPPELNASTDIDHQRIESLFVQLNKTILGNPLATKLSVACLLAQGHLLIEDIPGVGKTTLAHALATLFGLPFTRVQFTSDLLPTDILGMTIFDLESKQFQFKRGPIFTSALLADEINRATPKTQSALLQAMEEQQVSTDGKALDLPQPFFVIATQNPLDQSGTFALPESQLDRFLMRISLGYPGASYEKQLLKRGSGDDNRTTPLQNSIFQPQEVVQMTKLVDQVHVSDAIVDYLQSLLAKTRDSGRLVNGLSPRAGLQWLQAAKAVAFLEQRNAVLPEDIKLLANYTAAHRLRCHDGTAPDSVLAEIIDATEII